MVTGAALSTFVVLSAGVASMLFAASQALTINVCVPSARSSYSFGLVQKFHELADENLHWKKGASSSAEKCQAMMSSFVYIAGSMVMFVSGGVWSIVHSLSAGVGSAVPTSFKART